MKLKKWLKPLDVIGLFCNIYIKYIDNNGEKKEDLIYCGSMYHIPYWLVEYKIAPNDEDGESIFYAHGLKENSEDEKGNWNKEGFVITLQEKEN